MSQHEDGSESYESSEEEELNPGEAGGREEEWDEWNGDAEDADEDVTKSLFGPERLPNPEAAMQHDAEKHGFDLPQFAIQVRKMPTHAYACLAAGRGPSRRAGPEHARHQPPLLLPRHRDAACSEPEAGGGWMRPGIWPWKGGRVARHYRPRSSALPAASCWAKHHDTPRPAIATVCRASIMDATQAPTLPLPPPNGVPRALSHPYTCTTPTPVRLSRRTPCQPNSAYPFLRPP